MNKILVIHRYYKHRGGEDVFLDEVLIPTLKELPSTHIELCTFRPLTNLIEILFMFLGLEKLRPSYFKVKNILKNNKFESVILNNFIPTLSLEIPKLSRAHGAKVFSWVHNSRIICANGLSFDGKNECYDCLLNSSMSSFKKNCQKNILKSMLYAFIYRKKRVLKYLDNIHFLPVSKFASHFIDKAKTFKKLNNSHITIVPPLRAQKEDFAPLSSEIVNFIKNFNNQYYLFAGRLSYEKGADRMIEFANQLPHKAFILSGSGPLKDKLRKIAPKNVFFTQSDRLQLQGLYKFAEALIIPSRVKETFSLVIAESEPFKTPVVYPEGGGAEEAVNKLNRAGVKLSEFSGKVVFKNESQMKGFGNTLSNTLKNILSLN
ncbi:MAG: glycosyltransferase [Oligoflexia bacterium]|nr:glycosyltransferase [Oligoflexia bacterium]